MVYFDGKEKLEDALKTKDKISVLSSPASLKMKTTIEMVHDMLFMTSYKKAQAKIDELVETGNSILSVAPLEVAGEYFWVITYFKYEEA